MMRRLTPESSGRRHQDQLVPREFVEALVVVGRVRRTHVALQVVRDVPLGRVDGEGAEIRRVGAELPHRLLARRLVPCPNGTAGRLDDDAHVAGRVVHDVADLARGARRRRVGHRQQLAVGGSALPPDQLPVADERRQRAGRGGCSRGRVASLFHDRRRARASGPRDGSSQRQQCQELSGHRYLPGAVCGPLAARRCVPAMMSQDRARPARGPGGIPVPRLEAVEPLPRNGIESQGSS